MRVHSQVKCWPYRHLPSALRRQRHLQEPRICRTVRATSRCVLRRDSTGYIVVTIGEQNATPSAFGEADRATAHHGRSRTTCSQRKQATSIAATIKVRTLYEAFRSLDEKYLRCSEDIDMLVDHGARINAPRSASQSPLYATDDPSSVASDDESGSKDV